MKKLSTVIFGALCATALIVSTGCATFTPQSAASVTTLAVMEFGKDNQKRTKLMREMQPVACEIAKESGATVEDIIGAVQNSSGSSADTKEALQLVLTIYQSFAVPHGTNDSQTHPYMEAVVCDGWARGLALLPADGVVRSSTLRRNAPVKLPKGRWVIVR